MSKHYPVEQRERAVKMVLLGIALTRCHRERGAADLEHRTVDDESLPHGQRRRDVDPLHSLSPSTVAT